MAAIQNAMVIFPAAAFVAQYSAADDTDTAQQSVPLGRKYDACRHQTSADGEIAHRDHFQRVFLGGLIIARLVLLNAKEQSTPKIGCNRSSAFIFLYHRKAEKAIERG